MEKYRQIYWSYTYDRNAVRVVEPNMTLHLDKNGCLPNGNNYIYLFLIRQLKYEFYYGHSGPAVYPTLTNSSSLIAQQVVYDSGNLNNMSNSDYRDYGECDWEWGPGQSRAPGTMKDDGKSTKWIFFNLPYIVKITFSANNSYNTTQTTIGIQQTIREYTEYESSFRKIYVQTANITINWDPQEQEELTPVSTTYDYLISNDYIDYNNTIPNSTSIKILPQNKSEVFNYLEHTKYLYIKSRGLDVSPITASLNGTHFSIEKKYSKHTTESTSGNKTIHQYIEGWEIKVNQNTSKKRQQATINFYDSKSKYIFYYILKQQTEKEGLDIIDHKLDIQEDITKIYPSTEKQDLASTKKLVCIDSNTGSIIDNQSLLYKNIGINIYKTIEQKDNTLFVGNYSTIKSVNKVHSIINNQFKYIKYKESCFKKIYFKYNWSNNIYPEVPNMLLSAQDKHIFKNKEEYILGIVFINNRGEKSSVYFLGDAIDQDSWIPSFNPTEDTTGSFKKPVFVLGLEKELNNILLEEDIVGVIPVYAAHTSYRVICQGYISASMFNQKRKDEEGIGSQYSWQYRYRFPTSKNSDDVTIRYGNNRGFGGYEIQSLQTGETYSSVWKINQKILTLNTPEVEVQDFNTSSLLDGCVGELISNSYEFLAYTDVFMKVNGSYQYSGIDRSNIWMNNDFTHIPINALLTNSFYYWKGFINNEWPENEIMAHTGEQGNYGMYPVWMWQRNIPGAEGPYHTIQSKKWFTHMYAQYITKKSYKPSNEFPTISKAAIYYSANELALLNIGKNGVYQGNTDYIINCNDGSKYYLWAVSEVNGGGRSPKAPKGTVYAGYDEWGGCKDPISMKYKTPNHIVLSLEKDFTLWEYPRESPYLGDLTVLELYNPVVDMSTDVSDLKSYQWIQCGPMRQIKEDETTYITFEEGDYFYGRFDSLRTQPYTESDVNQVVEVVSGKLCSRINLDARTDRNRGNLTGNINNRNFNLFNPVYNQLNNYFTYYYEDVNDLIYDRSFKNSIQWSMTKTYGNEVDDWCNIQDVNTLDLDGDKGQVNALYKLGNNLLAFQDSGIAQIQYNEKTQLATDQGVPVEIANSGKVDGKYYLYNNIGCQNQQAITTSPTGIFFIDGINRNIYTITNQGELKDLTTTLGMNAWALKNLNTKWWSYYDSISQEVLFSNEIETLVYSDPYQNFRAFLGYGGIKHYFRAQDSTIQILPQNFNQVISLDQKEGVDIIKDSKKVDYKSVTLWKKNSQEESSFFGNNVPFEIEILCNPEHNQDKIFNNIEYRADSFSLDGTYIPNDTFTNLKVDTEYQTSGNISLDWSIDSPSNLSKKFRIWRIQIPRNQGTRDRIRNPWCKIKLSHNNNTNTNSSNKGIWQDVTSILSKEDIANLSKYTTLPQYAKDQYTVALYDGDIEDEDKFIGAYKYSSPSRFVFYDMNISYMI